MWEKRVNLFSIIHLHVRFWNSPQLASNARGWGTCPMCAPQGRKVKSCLKKSPLDLLLITDKYHNESFLYLFTDEHVTCYNCGGLGAQQIFVSIQESEQI